MKFSHTSKGVLLSLLCILGYVYSIIDLQVQTQYDNNGWYAGYYPDATDIPGYYGVCADDFVVPTGVNWTISSVSETGFFLPITDKQYVQSWTIYFYSSKQSTNFPGKTVPDQQLYAIEKIPDEGVAVDSPTITLPTPINFGPGQYFFGIIPTFNSTGAIVNSWAPGTRNTTTGVIGAEFAFFENGAGLFASFGLWRPAGSMLGVGNLPVFPAARDLVFTIRGDALDTQAPFLVSIAVNPAIIDLKDILVPKQINITLRVTDNFSGLSSGYITLSTPTGTRYELVDVNNLVVGTTTDGTFTTLAIVITKNSALVGTWTLTSLNLTDSQSNIITYNAAALSSKGASFVTVIDTSPVTTGVVTTAPATTGVQTTGVQTSSPQTSTGSGSDNINGEPSEGGSNAGAIAGAVVGSIVAIAIIAGLLIFFLVIRKKPQEQQKTEPKRTESYRNNNTTTAKSNTEQNSAELALLGPKDSYSAIPIPQINGNQSNQSPTSPASRPASEQQTNYNVIPIPRDQPTTQSFTQDNSFVIDYNELEMDKEIGRGAFGVVFKGRWRGGVVAIKQLNIQGRLTEKELEEFRGEAALMARLRPHVNVVQFLGITVSPQPLCIVTEFLDQGSLYGYLMGNAKMDPNITMNVVKGISAGMLHLHREGIIHRDLAARNVLLGSGFQVKISDFGMSRVQEKNKASNQTKSDTGPLKWMPPEAIINRVYSTKSDVWSFGVVLWEVICRTEPYPELDAVQTALAVTQGTRLPTPPYAPPVIAEMMSACFQTDPNLRPDFDVICKHFQNARLDQWYPPGFTAPVAPSLPQDQPQQQPQQQQPHQQEQQVNPDALGAQFQAHPNSTPQPGNQHYSQFN